MSNTENQLNQPEDSMVNPIESPTKSKDLTIVPSTTNIELEKLLGQVINLSSDNILHEPTCIICSSIYRAEIEQAWLVHKKTEDAITIFKNKTGKTISYEIIENHMTQHLTRGVREIQKIEYADRIKRLYNQNFSTLDRISVCFAMLTERLMGINSIVSNGEESIAEIEKIKSTETSRIMGVFNNLLKLQANILGEMKQSGELITIPSSQFINVFNASLIEAKTDREKQLIKNILNKLANINTQP